MPSRLHNLAWIREKTAARWDKMMRAGQLSPHDVARLHSATGASDKEGIQRGLQSFASPLSPQQLARHEQFHQKVMPHVERAYGVQLPDPQVRSPAYTTKGVIHASQPAVHAMEERWLGPLPPSSYRSTLEHEAAERRMQLAAAEGYQPRMFSSHLGPGALIAERLGFQNPDVHAFYDLARSPALLGWDTGDFKMLKKLRQHGMVGNYVMPLGGRAQRSLEFNRPRRRRLAAANAGKLRRNKSEWLADESSRAMLPYMYEDYLLPFERERGLKTVADRAPNFDQDPAYRAALEEIHKKSTDRLTPDRIAGIKDDKVTDPRVFIATQYGGHPPAPSR